MPGEPQIDHLKNLEEIVQYLMWVLQPDTILTELPYDLDFLNKSELEKYAEWCRGSVSEKEFDEGALNINEPITRYYVERLYPKLDKIKQTEKVKYWLGEMRKLLKIPEDYNIKLNPENIDKIKEKIAESPGEGHFAKAKRRIKIAIVLRWLHDKELSKKLSNATNEYIKRIGDFYGKCKKGENIDIKAIGAYKPPKEDLECIQENREKIDIALIEASKEIIGIKESQKREGAKTGIYGHFEVVVNAVNRINLFTKGGAMEGYDYIERFKDSLFMAIILNYAQDPYIRQTAEVVKLLEWIVPIYKAYKGKESIEELI